VYFDRRGKPITLRGWEMRLKKGEMYRRVALTVIGDDVSVSTVWLGLDHNFGQGPLAIFETMVFGGPLDEEQERYATEHEAQVGHDDMVTLVRTALQLELMGQPPEESPPTDQPVPPEAPA
jgi:hypothetical protein